MEGLGGVGKPSFIRSPEEASGQPSNGSPVGNCGPRLAGDLALGPPPSASLSGEAKRRIRRLIEIYYDVQDVRIRSYNRLRTVGEVKGVHPERLKSLEAEIRDYIQDQIENVPIYRNYLRRIKGLGPILSGGLISYFDPHRAEHASCFWRYAGLHVRGGRAVLRRKGERADFNPKIRTLCWKIGRSFLMAKNPTYLPIYLEARRRETEKLGNPIKNPTNCPHYAECVKALVGKAGRLGKKPKPPPCRLHIHLRALRKMVKRFLADLWAEWRKMEGLPVTDPYPIAILKHQKQRP